MQPRSTSSESAILNHGPTRNDDFSLGSGFAGLTRRILNLGLARQTFNSEGLKAGAACAAGGAPAKMSRSSSLSGSGNGAGPEAGGKAQEVSHVGFGALPQRHAKIQKRGGSLYKHTSNDIQPKSSFKPCVLENTFWKFQ